MNIEQKVNHYKLGVATRFPRLRKHRIGAHFGDGRVVGVEGDVARVALSEIIDAACRVCEISREQLVGPRRSRIYAWPRQIVMYIAREKCGHLSMPAIGRILGGRDHTTILHGVRACKIRIQDNPDFRELYRKIVTEAGFV